MVAVRFPLLTAPIAIGPLALRNRMVLCPMGDDLANPDGTVSRAQLDYYEARAAGGAGLLLVGSVSVAHPHGAHAAEQVAASEDRHVAGLAELADRAHRHGAAIGAQLVHAGPNAVLDIAEGRPMLVPAIPPRLGMDELSTMVTPEEMEAMTGPFVRPGATIAYRPADEDDLATVIERFAAAARRVAAAGFDAIEVHAGHGYLVDAFLSPRTNTRTDRWGGSLEGRSRLLVEVLGAVREAAGPGVAVWCRLNAREIDKPDGETLELAIATARIATAAGAQAIHVSAYADPGQAIGITSAHTPHAAGARLDDAAAIRAAVDVPVITMGRLTADAAEAALADGRADLIGFGRPLLADPGLPDAIVAGDPEAARPCAYQYRCIGNIFLHRPLACAVRPETGRPAEPPRVAPRRERVLVVGGGPVGMEAAHRLADAGHAVALWEATDRLGGLLVVAGAADPALAPLADWLRRRVADAGVEVALGRRASVDDLAAAGVDRVVLATGAPWPTAVAALDGPSPTRTLTVDDLRARPDDPLGAVPVGPVVVLGGGKAAVSLAGALRARGHETTLRHRDPVLAAELGLPGRFRLVHELRQAGVRLEADDAAPAAADLGPTPTDLDPAWRQGDGDGDGDGDGRAVPAAIVDADPAHRRARSLPEAELRGRLDPHVPLHLIGDATGGFGLEAGFAAAAALAREIGIAPGR